MVPLRAPAGDISVTFESIKVALTPIASLEIFVTISIFDTDAIEDSASPLNPFVLSL